MRVSFFIVNIDPHYKVRKIVDFQLFMALSCLKVALFINGIDDDFVNSEIHLRYRLRE